MTVATAIKTHLPNSKPSMQPVGNFSVKSRGSVDPSKYPNETFELFSISAYDLRQPEIIMGKEIGSAKKIVAPGDGAMPESW